MPEGAVTGRLAVIVLAAALAGCAIDDSGAVRSVWRPASGNPTYSNVIYVTDRERDLSVAGDFSTRWAASPSCGTAMTVVPAALVPGEEAKWGYVAKTTPAQCAAGKDRLGNAIALIKAQAESRHCRSVFLFVHGFHTGFDGASLRAAQIAHDAQTGCAVAVFSWSAEADVERYVADVEHSGYSQPLLAEFLRELAETHLRITVVAHSLGSRLMLMTLSGLGQDRHPPPQGFIDEMVLAAGDVGIEPNNNDFQKLMAAAAPFVKRTTVYVSGYDTVLEMSRREHGGVPRLGVGTDLSFKANDTTHVVDIIDASNARGDRLGHSYFAMSYEVMTDITLVLNGVPAERRLKPAGGWPATLSCGGGSNCRLNTSGKPRFVTQLILNLLPIVPMVR